MKSLRLYASLLFTFVVLAVTGQAYAATASGGPQPATVKTAAELCQDSGGTWVASRGTVTATGSCTNCPAGKQPNGNVCVGVTLSSAQVGCPNSGFFGLSAWYKYLSCDQNVDSATGATVYFPRMNGLQDIWRVVAAIMEILLKLSSVLAIGFVVYGGVTYILSQGAPDKTSAALKTIIAALVGLVISIVAAALVGFIAGRFDGGKTNSSTVQPTTSDATRTPLTTQQQPR